MAPSEFLLAEIDAPAGLLLSAEAGWNQTVEDWRLFIAHGRTLGLRDAEGRIGATAAALPYDGPLGFVGMVLVTPDWRHQGFATRLMGACIEHLRVLGKVPVLDATPAGAPVYEKLGFQLQFGLERWEAAWRGGPSINQMVDKAAIQAADAAALGAKRGFLLDAFLARPASRVLSQGEDFVMARAGHRATQIGPLVARSAEAAIALLKGILAGVVGPVFLDLQTRWTQVAAWLEGAGFQRQRPFSRMALGRAEPFGDPSRLFVPAGPEFG